MSAALSNGVWPARQVLVLKEGTEVREVAVPPLALTADGRALTEAPAENGSAATSPRELALALALQVCSMRCPVRAHCNSSPSNGHVSAVEIAVLRVTKT